MHFISITGQSTLPSLLKILEDPEKKPVILYQEELPIGQFYLSSTRGTGQPQDV